MQNMCSWLEEQTMISLSSFLQCDEPITAFLSLFYNPSPAQGIQNIVHWVELVA